MSDKWDILGWMLIVMVGMLEVFAGYGLAMFMHTLWMERHK